MLNRQNSLHQIILSVSRHRELEARAIITKPYREPNTPAHLIFEQTVIVRLYVYICMNIPNEAK